MTRGRRKEYILCAAIHVQDGKVYRGKPVNVEGGFVICGWRHHNCIWSVVDLGRGGSAQGATQGFLTSHNRFVGRREAQRIAWRAGQVATRKYNPSTRQWAILFSEDLY